MIRDEDIHSFVIESMYMAPLMFFTQPASMSGKHHPLESLGIGGLMRHTKATVVIAKAMFELYEFNENTEDLIIASLYLHDLMKPGIDHPIEVRLQLEPLRDNYSDIYEAVIPLIEAHTGKWDNFGKFPRPSGTVQKFVHMCDYLSSQSFIHIETIKRD